ncbi:MAG: hypothetical protein Q8N91_02805 [Candidatus Omnitrophota bacterium]|nr:hypothetical protein [Candidatus Omnitrophota bacterium]
MRVKLYFNRTLFFLGWMLSPFTLWNDVFINIPLSYLAASLAANFCRVEFLKLILIAYWISNALGMLLMYFCGKKIAGKGRGFFREAIYLIMAIAFYSLLLVALNRAGIIRPIRILLW